MIIQCSHFRQTYCSYWKAYTAYSYILIIGINSTIDYLAACTTSLFVTLLDTTGIEFVKCPGNIVNMANGITQCTYPQMAELAYEVW